MQTTTTERTRRVRTVVYLQPDHRRRLKVAGAQTDRSGGSIVEEALDRLFEDWSRPDERQSA